MQKLKWTLIIKSEALKNWWDRLDGFYAFVLSAFAMGVILVMIGAAPLWAIYIITLVVGLSLFVLERRAGHIKDKNAQIEEELRRMLS